MDVLLRFVWFFCGALLLLSVLGRCSKIEEDLTVSFAQKQILDKFRDRVLSYLKDEYMKDMYLIRWLRAKDFNLDATENMLLENLRWRKENNIDNLDKEDWSYFEAAFSYSIDSVDKLGQPLIIIDQDKWYVRDAVLTGRKDMLVKWMVKMMEDATKRVSELESKGHNVTRWSMVNTLQNFNLIQSGCPQCVFVFTSFVNNYETHYPNMMDQLILVNTPGIFDIVVKLIKPLMTPGTRKALRLLGTNKKQWQAELLQDISSDQLPPAFGGTKLICENYDE